MNLHDIGFNPLWLAAGGIFALLAGFWNHVTSLINQVSKIMVISMPMDAPTSIDVVRYMRAHYKWIQFSEFHVHSVYKTRLDNGMGVWVPFKLPTTSGLYRGPHGWVWLSGHDYNVSLKAIRGRFDFIQLVKDANAYDTSLRQQENPNRYYVRKVIGSEKGAWALGESLRDRGSSGDVSGNEPSASPTSQKSQSVGEQAVSIRVYEDIDQSFLYKREDYTRSGRDDPFKGLFFTDAAIKEVNDARSWMRMSKWYAERSIPWRRGLMLYGPPGTGKSSFTKALAESLGIPIYLFFLNTLSDQEFIREWGAMQTPCIALLEDFDNVFHGREPRTEHKALTFDCVLNQISGVAAANGVYLVVTTNDISKIDPAMGVSKEGGEGISTRPGRVDRVLYMGDAPEEQRVKIAQHILKDWPEHIDAIVTKTDKMTPAQVQEVCTQLAYEKLLSLSTKTPRESQVFNGNFGRQRTGQIPRPGNWPAPPAPGTWIHTHSLSDGRQVTTTQGESP
jgi:hypothetical protein